MAVTINASTSSGLVQSADNSGVLTLQTNSGTSALSISTGQQLQVHTAGSASAPVISKSDDTNTGIYFPGADRIGFAEGGTQVGEFDASGNFQFNSGYGSVATAYGCRAWVNFNGTGTVAIRASGNVTSITDNGTGDYTVNFTTAMPNTNYTTAATCIDVNFGGVVCIQSNTANYTASSVRLLTFEKGANAYFDAAIVCAAIFR